MGTEMIEIVLTILLVIDCIALTVVVLLQEGKSGGLSSLSGGGQSGSYWGQNRGRSMEGTMEKITAALAVLFFVLVIALNLGIFNA